MRLARMAPIAFVFALAACSRSALEEESPDSLEADAATAPTADAAFDAGMGCGRGVVCGTSTDCPPGQELCNVGCPQRQNFAPPVCMPGPCPANLCPVASGDAASP